MTKLRLRDIFDGWDEGQGLFALFNSVPWSEDTTVSSTKLDLAYFGAHSGSKNPSGLVRYMYDKESNLSTTDRQRLADILTMKFHTNWQRLWDSNVISYSPINNYDITETVESEKTNNDTETLSGTSHTEGETTITRDTQHTTTHGRSITEELDTYGFNSGITSADAKPRDRNTSTEGGTTELADTGTDTGEIDQTITDNKTKTNTDSEEYGSTMRRSGNIGVTTNQQLISEERELRKWNFFDAVFADIDSILTLRIHS